MITEAASFLAFPLRLQDGFLRRAGATDAIVSLLQVMAASSHGAWKGSEQFGVREFFEYARQQPELPEAAIQQINAALENLGIVHLRVESITKDGPSENGREGYTVTLSTPQQQRLRKSFALRP